MTEKSMEVFQDLHLRGRSSSGLIRSSILAQVREPWHHALKQEEDIRTHADNDEDVIVLVRASSDGIDESSLVLWEEHDGYKVSNIVPRNVRELGIAKYNAILRDFVTRVAESAAQAGSFEIKLTAPNQVLEDWLDGEPATALQRFSRLANKSTGAAHPRDRERWYAFLIAAHCALKRLDSDQLARWLVEVEGWSAEKAEELAIDYEFALGLLKQYDQSHL